MMNNTNKNLIKAIEETFCEVMNLNSCYSDLVELMEKYNQTLVYYDCDEDEDFDLLVNHDDVLNKIEASEDVLYTKMIDKQKDFNLLIEKVIDTSNKVVFEYLFGKSLVIKDTDVFVKSLSQCMSVITKMHISQVPNQKKIMVETLRTLVEIMTEQMDGEI